MVPINESQAFSAAKGNFWQENCVLNAQQFLWVPSLLQRECSKLPLTYLPAYFFTSAETDVIFLVYRFQDDHQGIALSLEPFTTAPRPESFCSHFIKLNALTMSFSHTKHPKAAVQTALLGSSLPLEQEFTASAQALSPEVGRDADTRVRARGSAAVPTCAGWPTLGQCVCPAEPCHAMPCHAMPHGTHPPNTDPAPHTRDIETRAFAHFFLMYHNEQETYVMK